MSLQIDLLVTPDCPHAAAAEGLVRNAAARLAPGSTIATTIVRDAAEAARLEFPGSPTVRVNGEDLEGGRAAPPAYACRTYGDGAGAPPEWLVEARLLRALGVGHLLFLCVANSARSQMAEGIARSLAPPEVQVASAGSEPARVNPHAIRALEEIGVDPSGQRSKSASEVRSGGGDDVDVVITLCAEEVCPAWLGDARQAHWPLPDPAAAEGTEDEIMAAFRAVRDELGRRLELLFDAPATARE